MGFLTHDYYDFHCGNDTRLVKIAIMNNGFHTITIHADIAKTIDFTGGTQRVEKLRLSNCFKASRINWPDRTGFIKKLYIHHLDTITRLDLTALSNLEELSIMNCAELESIIGIPDTLKICNLHDTKIKSLDLATATHLESLNITTNSSELHFDLSNHGELNSVYIKTADKIIDDQSGLRLNLNDCRKLTSVCIDTGNNPVDIQVSNCNGLDMLGVICGNNSEAEGLKTCAKLNEYYSNRNLSLESTSKLKLIDPQKPSEKITIARQESTEFYKIVLDDEPGIHDRETIIHERGSTAEVGKSKGVEIILLSAPVALHENVNEKEMFANDIKRLQDNFGFPESFLALSNMIIQASQQEQFSKLPFANQSALLRGANSLKQAIMNLTDTFEETAKSNFRPTPKETKQNNIYLNQERLQDEIVEKEERLRERDKKDPRDRAEKTDNTTAAALAPPGILSPANILNAQSGSESFPAHEISHVTSLNSSMPRPADISQQPAPDAGVINRTRVMPDDAPEMIDGAASHSEPPPIQRSAAPDEPIEIDAEAESPPDMKPKVAPQVPIVTPLHSDERDQRLLAAAKHKPAADLPEQTIVSGEAEPPPDIQPKSAPQIPTESQHTKTTLPDIPEQTELSAEAVSPPDLQPKFAPQVPIDTQRKKIELPDIPEQIEISAEAESPPDVQPKFASQVPINIQHRKTDLPDIHEQIEISGEAESPPDLQPKFAPQVPIDTQHKKTSLPDIPEQIEISAEAVSPPDIQPKFAPQEPIDHEHKKSELPDLPDQAEITSEASSPPPDMQPKYAPQMPIDAKHTQTKLFDAPPLNPNEREQRLLAAAKKKAELDFPDQVEISAEAESKPESPLQNAEPLIPEQTEGQMLLEANKGIVAPLIIEPTNDQVYLGFSGKSIFTEKPLQKTKKMVVEPTLSQQHIFKQEVRHEVKLAKKAEPVTHQKELLAAARNVAEALQKMLKSDEKLLPSKVKKVTKKSIYSEANNLLKELNNLNKILAENIPDMKNKKNTPDK